MDAQLTAAARLAAIEILRNPEVSLEWYAEFTSDNDLTDDNETLNQIQDRTEEILRSLIAQVQSETN